MKSPKKSFHCVQLLIVCAFLTAAATDAVTITWYYEGAVQSVSHNQGGSGDAGDFQPGASFHGSITFDDGATTTSEGIFSRRLTGADLGLTISTRAGENVVIHDGNYRGSFLLDNDVPVNDHYMDNVHVTSRPDLYSFTLLGLQLFTPNPSEALASLAFPPALPKLEDFNWNTTFVMRLAESSSKYTQISGTITSLSLSPTAVPETGSSIILMLAGLGTLIGFARVKALHSGV